MSYLERLSQIRDNLKRSQDSFQAQQDEIVRNAPQFLASKVNHIAEQMEAVGSLGFGAIKSGKSVKGLIDKIRGKKKGKEGKEETEDKTAEEQQPEDIPEETPSTVEAEQPKPPEEPAEPGEDVDLTGRVDFEGTFERGLPPSEGPPGVATKDYTGEGFEEGTFERPVEVNLNPQEPTPADMNTVESEPRPAQADMERTGYEPPEPTGETSHLPNDVEMNDVAGSEFQRPSTTLQTETQGQLQQTQTQRQIQDGDPEDLTGNVSNDAGNVLEDTGAEIGDEAGSGFMDAMSGVLTADTVLDAIPVVGEVAMIGTAIAGFFEALFGGDSTPDKPKTPPPPNYTPSAGSIVSGVGVDASSLISKAGLPSIV